MAGDDSSWFSDLPRFDVATGTADPTGDNSFDRAVMVVREWLRAHGVTFREPEAGAFAFLLEGPHGVVLCDAVVCDSPRLFLFYVHTGARFQPDRLAAVQDLSARINDGLMVGNFEVDHDGRGVRFKVGFEFTDASLSAELVRNAITHGIKVAAKYLAVWMAVIYTTADPEQVLVSVERPG